MIYQQSFIFYFLAAITSLLTIFRLKNLFAYTFQKSFSTLLALIVVLHPLSIDAFMAPNLMAGGLAFLFFIEAQLYLKKENIKPAFLFLLLASLINMSYALFPIYTFFMYRKSLKNYWPQCLLYSLLFFILNFRYSFLFGSPPEKTTIEPTASRPKILEIS